ncbi:PEP-CTERM sorting domain-containing protein [Nostoc sp. FACHB-87]|uniref:PEP-CTERM sorting domain-containing protein n=1 Tax=Nostocales TaxID=1161 RepID=UPI001685DAAC|nr:MULTISPECIES: PEP-CTERM sorting domain-containing protein [Nostocales]MBD2300199.1 PEP-CTERM sorting domain-containing protein [Nostoc sp. FACHB-190]MBD2456543.1 PEP-CTERM sorting domain-containing protein [Nostoc sp. FACHB-87]MBD2477194.1 PEP-CTERM sorting domain-containing protein [Anabaena sp. FACHB-83]MBD2485989.1 PEP-CTERM sorting domain-containing protein [Aulosira sp. FACHB-615]
MIKSLKNIFQSAAIASIGVGILATVGISPASAINLQRYELSVDFGSNGSASGYYIVDQNQLPLNSSVRQVILSEWDITLTNTSGTVIDRLFNNLGNPSSPLNNSTNIAGIIEFQVGVQPQIAEALAFVQSSTTVSQLVLGFGRGFTGIGSTNFIQYSRSRAPSFAGITATSLQANNATPVPEPLTLGGVVIGSGFGLWMKRKQKALVKV